jgi:curved DNA-binding protein CbpA
MVNLYEVLGVAPSASETEIRNAFRAQARRLHPDMPDAPADASDRMAVVNHAHSVLSDSSQRRAYDRSIGLTSTTRFEPAGGKPPHARPAEGTSAPGEWDGTDQVAPSSPLSALVAVFAAFGGILLGIGFVLSPGLIAVGLLLLALSGLLSVVRFRNAIAGSRRSRL